MAGITPIDPRPEERVALLLILGIACGIPLFSRWRERLGGEQRVDDARPRLRRLDDRVDGAQPQRRIW